ncbi:MAG: sensor histidine kinase [Actinobacteria bacterium]|nr:sensor histidine kinase [Actinomycetota bacterium]
MPTLVEIAHEHGNTAEHELAHLGALVSEWGMLADFCFADMLLYLPTKDNKWIVAAQVRAATGQTLYETDLVGLTADSVEMAMIAQAFTTQKVVTGEIRVVSQVDPVSLMAIPVRCDDRVIAVLTREWSTRSGRKPGQLERTYLAIFDDFTKMISTGLFPFEGRVADATVAPRVRDGVIVLDADARVRYASPNAVSAMHRVGVNANAVGQSLAELGVAQTAARNAFERREPVVEEVEQTSEVTLLTRTIPTLKRLGRGVVVTGGVVLLRDVSELRRRDRLLLTKDATIREIHHRVKNNLQTISSLLRLQARRLKSEEAISAIAESVRRIRTIALVHETLSHEAGEDISFVEIVRPLLRLVEEGLQSTDRPVKFSVQGDGGRLPATIATPLSVVILELLQNAVDHGFPEGSAGGSVLVTLSHDDESLDIRVTDNGRGLRSDFNIKTAIGLGLSIVRTLVTTELAGTIQMRPALIDDSVGELKIATDGAGTVVDLKIPFTGE